MDKPSWVPNVIGGEILMPPDKQRFFTFGGYFPRLNSSLQKNVQPEKDRPGDLIVYDPESDQWVLSDLGEGSDRVIWSQGGGSVSIPERGLSFYLGGYQSSRSNAILSDNEYRVVPGFLRLQWDTFNPSEPPRWKNESNPFDQTIGGELVYIPTVGTQGILVKFGGWTALVGETQIFPGIFKSLQQVQIYDIANAVWYEQTTMPAHSSYSIPSARSGTCTTMVAAPDNSSYNIYVYGGNPGGENGELAGLQKGGWDGVDELWVLSLPGFIWIKIYDNGKYLTNWMSCELINGNQIFLVGPRVKRFNETGYPKEDCRPLWSVFDISQNEWKTTFDPNNKARVPVRPEISTFVGGGGSGNAIMKSPAAGWTDDAIKALFDLSPSGTQNNITITPSGIPSGTPSSSPTKINPSKRVNLAAIIGGAAGGLIAFVLIGCCLFLLCHRRRVRAALENLEPQPQLPQELLAHEYPGRELDGQAIVEILDSHSIVELDAWGHVDSIYAADFKPEETETTISKA